MKPEVFFKSVKAFFIYLIDEYNFTIVHEEYFEASFGCCLLVFQSEACYLKFFWDGKEYLVEVSTAIRLSSSSPYESVQYGDWIDLNSFREYLDGGAGENKGIYAYTSTDAVEIQMDRLNIRLQAHWSWLLPLFKRDLFKREDLDSFHDSTNDRDVVGVNSGALRLRQDCLRSLVELRRAYGFLESQQGFSFAYANVLFARFESSQVFIHLHYDRFGYPTPTYFGPISVSTDMVERFTPGELQRITGKQVPQSFFRGGTPREVILAKRAEIFREHYVEDVRQSFEMIEQLRTQKKIDDDRTAARVAQQEDENKLRSARFLGDAAWRSKAYGLVISQYESIGTKLTTTEAERLEFARRQISRR